MLYEDGYETPVWMDFQRTWVSNGHSKLYNVLKEIEQFQKTHPSLKLVNIEENCKEVNVIRRDPLFFDEKQIYYERKYSFQKYSFTCYFEPDQNLLDYLVGLQEFIDWNKSRCFRQKNHHFQ